MDSCRRRERGRRPRDNTFAGPGKLALWTKADSVTHFDTTAITSLD
jgi:hypothetical protein